MCTGVCVLHHPLAHLPFPERLLLRIASVLGTSRAAWGPYTASPSPSPSSAPRGPVPVSQLAERSELGCGASPSSRAAPRTRGSGRRAGPRVPRWGWGVGSGFGRIKRLLLLALRSGPGRAGAGSSAERVLDFFYTWGCFGPPARYLCQHPLNCFFSQFLLRFFAF